MDVKAVSDISREPVLQVSKKREAVEGACFWAEYETFRFGFERQNGWSSRITLGSAVWHYYDLVQKHSDVP